MRLEGAAALVTGAGRRIGQAIAIGLAESGCDVAVHYHGSAKGAEETALAVRKAGRRAALVSADLRDPSAARGLADQAARALQRLDIVVNSAAIMVRQSVETVTPESWDTTLDLNLEDEAQKIMEQNLSKYGDATGVHNGALLSMDARSGEILVMHEGDVLCVID